MDSADGAYNSNVDMSPSRPFTREDITRAFRKPHLVLEILMAKRARFAASVASGKDLGLLVLLLLLVSGIACVPYGLVEGPARFWRVAALFTGSVLICFPSLHVFGSFLGFRSKLGQNLALALIISGVASLFTLGFAPILWFLQTTTEGGGSSPVVHGISITLLITSLLAGIIHLSRCLCGERRLRTSGAYSVLIIFWQMLLIFITCRMGIYLELV